MIKLNLEVKKILSSLTDNGFEAYLVGGAVRNYLLGIDVYDFDITTNATPNEIIKVFSHAKTILTGVKFGTVTVIYNNQKYEITTYRIDNHYEDNRHPSSVIFSKSLENDLGRRDFTINALAYNDKLIDLYKGIEDLKNKIIRCIGNPDIRFREDALRILRALRFSAKLDFYIEEETKKAIINNKNLLKNVAIERINNELFDMLKHINISLIIDYFDIFATIFPFIKKTEKEIIINKIANMIKNNINDYRLYYSSFFICVSEDDLQSLLSKYKLSNEIRKLILFVNNKNLHLSNDEILFRKLLKKHAKNDIINYINYNIFDEKERVIFLKVLEDADKKCNHIKDLMINGSDLKKEGIIDSDIGKIMNKILDLVIEGKLDNDKKNIMNSLENIKRL